MHAWMNEKNQPLAVGTSHSSYIKDNRILTTCFETTKFENIYSPPERMVFFLIEHLLDQYDFILNGIMGRENGLCAFK